MDNRQVVGGDFDSKVAADDADVFGDADSTGIVAEAAVAGLRYEVGCDEDGAKARRIRSDRYRRCPLSGYIAKKPLAGGFDAVTYDFA